MSMHSCIYAGHVRHRRFTPLANEFRYRVYMMYLDLAELPRVFAGRWLWSGQPGDGGLSAPAGSLGGPSITARPGG